MDRLFSMFCSKRTCIIWTVYLVAFFILDNDYLDCGSYNRCAYPWLKSDVLCFLHASWTAKQWHLKKHSTFFWKCKIAFCVWNAAFMCWLLERSEDVGILRYFIYVGVVLTGMTLPVTSKLHSISHLELEKVPSLKAFLVGFTGLHMFVVWFLWGVLLYDDPDVELLVWYFFLFRAASIYIEFATSVPTEHILHTPEGAGYQLVDPTETNGGNVDDGKSDLETPVVVMMED